MKLTIEIVGKLLEKSGHGHFDYCEKYSEPGYSTEHATIIFANWNGLKRSTMDAITKQFEIEWSDEWWTCGNCGGAVRNTGNSHHWTPYYDYYEGSVLCGDCLLGCEGETQGYIESLLNNAEKCNIFSDLDLEKHGFTELECGFESGWHPGQDASPEKILAAAQKEHPDFDFVFGDLQTSQFYSSFCLYMRPKNWAASDE